MGADVKIVVTENAVNMVPVQVLERMSGNPVQIEQFGRPVTWAPNYKSWGRGGDLLVIAPCTANMMGKLANGIADDYLSTNTLSFDGPKMIAMNMNPKLYANPAVQRNIKQLKEDGYSFVAPESEDKPSKFPGVDAVIVAVCSALEKETSEKALQRLCL